ncbi:hypothetical protein NSK_004645 [Nannochloropsis salina CCMP1776]|uniref:Uncharacterized protein n=1 Tax=Nannochloropsis salina CCMP1776 TaxID=1027361 RepID=A0A4D9D2C6_9STRA|nr:hypothetical protein NSK_004645 [Nannochloropsis salina CCMP1776]|eukprot:TFJ84173.1 hypothetical protein NSK_004645 [Nannochloropsis salina CCMP1776]
MPATATATTVPPTSGTFLPYDTPNVDSSPANQKRGARTPSRGHFQGLSSDSDRHSPHSSPVSPTPRRQPAGTGSPYRPPSHPPSSPSTIAPPHHRLLHSSDLERGRGGGRGEGKEGEREGTGGAPPDGEEEEEDHEQFRLGKFAYSFTLLLFGALAVGLLITGALMFETFVGKILMTGGGGLVLVMLCMLMCGGGEEGREGGGEEGEEEGSGESTRLLLRNEERKRRLLAGGRGGGRG